jgi:hypothetical protein
MSSIFLSHAFEDKQFARKLAKDLRQAGHIVWIDEAEIKVGDSSDLPPKNCASCN